MSPPGDVKLAVLKMLMQEDRTEARTIRARIENVVWALVAASFAITAFWLKSPSQPSCTLWRLVLLSDVSLLLAILAAFSRSMIDLRQHRKAQEARQELFLQLANDEDLPRRFNPFPDTRKRQVSLKDHDMLWLLGAAIYLMALKTIVSLLLLG